MLQALSEKAGHGGALTEASIKDVLKPYWNNDLMLTIISEHTTGLVRDAIMRRVKFLDLKSQAIKLLIFAAIGIVILGISALTGH